MTVIKEEVTYSQTGAHVDHTSFYWYALSGLILKAFNEMEGTHLVLDSQGNPDG